MDDNTVRCYAKCFSLKYMISFDFHSDYLGHYFYAHVIDEEIKA